MARAKPTKTYREVAQIAAELGWDTELQRSGHIKFTRPGCRPVYTSSTPSDVRVPRNLRAKLARVARGAPG